MHRIIMLIAGLVVAVSFAVSTALANIAPTPEPTRPGHEPATPVYRAYCPIMFYQPEVWGAIPGENK